MIQNFFNEVFKTPTCLTCLPTIACPYKAIRPKFDTFTSNHNCRVVHFWGQWRGTKALPGPGSQDRRWRGDPGRWKPSDSVSRCTKDHCWCWASLCPKIEQQHWWLVLCFQWVLSTVTVWSGSWSVEGMETHSQMLIVFFFLVLSSCVKMLVNWSIL